MKHHHATQILYAAALFFSLCSSSHAGLYDIDASFGNSGRYNQPLPGSDFRTLAHLPQPDGTSIAIVTYDNNGCPAGRHCLGIYPFNAAGEAEGIAAVPNNMSFSKRSGTFVVDYYLVKAAAIDSQGRIVIAGTEQIGTTFQFRVIRLLPDGQPDTSFDGDGIALPGFFTGQSDDVAAALAIDSSDRIVVAGRARFSATDTDFAVLRLTSAGALDTDFSNDGKLTIAFDLAGAGDDGVAAMDILPGGQIYLAGNASDGEVTRIALAKLLPAGTLDPSFCATSCAAQGLYTGYNNGRRVSFYGQSSDNLSDTVRSLTVNVSGEMVYAGLHVIPNGGGAVQLFTQKMALNGDYAAEGLSDVGLPDTVEYIVGGIRYVNRSSVTSDLVLTGTGGPSRKFFFAQGLSRTLIPKSNWGTSGTNASALVYTASGGFGDNPGNRPAIPSVDANERILVGGSYYVNADDSTFSMNVMRLSRADLMFRNGFE